jgi:2-hydroxychromene-2-carboxylate isomerase
MVPLFEMNAAKRAYMGKDLQDWAKVWGVPLRFPDAFPLNTVKALRLAIIEPRLTAPLYRAAWVEGRDLGAVEVLTDVVAASSLDAASLLAQTADPAIKEQLRANTADAELRGAFGAPSFVLHRPDEPSQLFWGQDRLPLLCEALTAPR